MCACAFAGGAAQSDMEVKYPPASSSHTIRSESPEYLPIGPELDLVAAHALRHRANKRARGETHACRRVHAGVSLEKNRNNANEGRRAQDRQGPDTQGGRHSVRPPKERVLKRGVLQQAL